MLKSEITIKIKEAMNEKGIQSYEELFQMANVKVNNRFTDIIKGRQCIKEEDLLKLSKTLDIPMEYFTSQAQAEIKYRFTNVKFVETDTEERRAKRKAEIKKYNTKYKREWRKRHKERIHEKELEYAREYRKKHIRKEVEKDEI